MDINATHADKKQNIPTQVILSLPQSVQLNFGTHLITLDLNVTDVIYTSPGIGSPTNKNLHRKTAKNGSKTLKGKTKKRKVFSTTVSGTKRKSKNIKRY